MALSLSLTIVALPDAIEKLTVPIIMVRELFLPALVWRFAVSVSLPAHVCALPVQLSRTAARPLRCVVMLALTSETVPVAARAVVVNPATPEVEEVCADVTTTVGFGGVLNVWPTVSVLVPPALVATMRR